MGGQIVLGAAEIDPVVFRRVGDRALCRCDRLGERLALDRDGASGGNHVENLAFEQIRAGIDFVGRRFVLWAVSRRTLSISPFSSWTTQPKAEGSSTVMRCNVPRPPFSRWKRSIA